MKTKSRPPAPALRERKEKEIISNHAMQVEKKNLFLFTEKLNHMPTTRERREKEKRREKERRLPAAESEREIRLRLDDPAPPLKGSGIRQERHLVSHN